MKTYSVPAVLLAGVLISTPLTLVQANDPADHGMDQMEHKEHGWEPGDMKKELGLTDDQVSKLKAIRESQKAAIKPLRDKQQELNQKLQGQVKNKASEADIQATLNEIRSNRKAMTDQIQQFHQQKEAILTPTQQAQIAVKMQNRMEHRHDRREERKEGRQGAR